MVSDLKLSSPRLDNASRKLYLHAGGSKTGTSALQNYLGRYASSFEEYGFSYRNGPFVASIYDVTSGNGEALFAKLYGSNSSDEELASTIQSYFSTRANAICSSELFEDCSGADWSRLANLVSELGIELHVIFFVRDLIRFFQSAYDQAIKRHGEHRSFSGWSNSMKWTHVEALRALVDRFPAERLHVIHYDEATRSIFPPFLSAMGLESMVDPAEIHRNTVVNRSLTRQEREALKSLNAVMDADGARELADLFMEFNRRAWSEPAWVSPRLARSLVHRFADDCAWLNSTFFNGDDVVAIMRQAVPEPSVRPEIRRAPTERSSVDRLAFIWVLDRLKAIKLQTHLTTLQMISAAISRYATGNAPDLPEDFDVLVYLIKNPDVLLSGVDPISHYVLHGKSEGRLYKNDQT
jgi:hypothetical protein